MKKIIFFAFIISFTACRNNNESNPAPTSAPVVAEAPAQTETKPFIDTLSDKPGIYKVIELPEILTLAIKDSGMKEDIGYKMAQNYGAIESDMNELGLSNMEMPPGAIFYNDNPKNFIFECIIPINKMPAKNPKNSTVVILEATRALVFNYYGPYDKMTNAYAEIKKYMNQNKLEQGGPVREFYLSDPTVEKDPSKWLSKIYVPVK